ncbi:MAG TPA: cation:proton antiporter [Steroidobacteraceae bacterium]|nr:cation:proton antiporter [Steroidobacteraceae bacterium]
MNAFWFVLVGVLLIVIALLGRFLDRLPVSPAMIYLLVGMALGPAALNAIELHPLRELTLLESLSEVALLIALFTVGIKLRVPIGDARWSLPLRLATLSMGATVLGITLVAWLFFGFSPGLALVLGATLAPTDPVLASEVQLRSPQDRDALRFGLTGEGGLNDGTAFPFVLLGLGVLGAGEATFSLWHWLSVDVLWSVVVGLGSGFAVGTVLAAGVRAMRARFSNAVFFDEFLLLGVIALSYGVALSLHALGFLAVFAAGLALRRADDMHAHGLERSDDITPRSPLTPSMLSVNEQLERIAEVAIVLLVGVMISTGYWSVTGLCIAALLFLVIRPLSVYAGLAGAPAARVQRRLIGWFGIRGIGSFYYAIYSVNLGSDEILYTQAEQLLSCVFTVIAASIIVHGISAAPLMELYQRRWSRGRGRVPTVSDKR